MGKLVDAARKFIAWHDGKNAEELMNAVVEAENSMRWIPVEEQLPRDPEMAAELEEFLEYNVTISGAQLTTTLMYEGNGKWWDAATDTYYPVEAWRPMPEPYKPGS